MKAFTVVMALLAIVVLAIAILNFVRGEIVIGILSSICTLGLIKMVYITNKEEKKFNDLHNKYK